MTKITWSTAGDVFGFLLILAVVIGILQYSVYKDEARRLADLQSNCAEGWEYMIFAGVEACVRPLGTHVDFTATDNQSGNAVRITYGENEDWLFSGTSPR